MGTHEQTAEQVRRHGSAVLTELSTRVALTTQLWVEPNDRLLARDGLVQFCTDRMLPYLVAIDRVVYQRAAGRRDTLLLVAALRRIHQDCADRLAALEAAGDADDIVAAAHAMVASFSACVQAEHEVLLPALAERRRTRLDRAAAELPALLGSASPQPPQLSLYAASAESPSQRDRRVVAACGSLLPGSTLELVAARDPAPLQERLDRRFPDEFRWRYLEAGPTWWRVRIDRRGQG